MSKTILDSGRLAARWSVILVFACFVSTCVGNLFDAKWGVPGRDGVAHWIGSTIGLLCLLGSIGLGAVGAARGWRNKDWDTVMIAGIGLFLGTGMLGLMAWLTYRIVQRG